MLLTTQRSSASRRAELRARGVTVHVVADRDGVVDLAAGASCLRSLGIELLLVEGGAQVITGLLRARLVDRLIVAVAPSSSERGRRRSSSSTSPGSRTGSGSSTAPSPQSVPTC